MTDPGSGLPPAGPPGPPASDERAGGDQPPSPRPAASRTTPPSTRSTPGAGADGLHVPTDVFSRSWPAQAADTIVGAVDTVRDKTTGPIQTAARGLVYGILAAVLGTVVLVLVIVGAVRLLDAVQPWGNVWLPYLELGLVFLVAGVLVFRRRRLVEG